MDRIKVSIKDVARAAAVSTSTVSHVLNGTRVVAPETQKRVRKAINELGYQKNDVARMLRKNRSYCIGVLVPDISHDFYSSVMRGIESVLNKQGYNIILSDSREIIENEIKQLSVFMSMQVDGIIFSPTRDVIPEISESYYNGCPIVSVDRRIKNAEFDSVETSNEQSSYEVTRYFIEHGHRRIVFATARPELSCCVMRLMGYKRALSEFGIPYDDQLFKVVQPTVESGKDLIQWAMYQTDASAMLVNNLHASVGVLQYANEKQIDIPGRIAVMGYDDSIWARVTNPPLSTIQTKSVTIGVAAANMLLARINNANKGIENVIIQSDVVYRGTT